jgi:hypothetical protein
LIQVVSSHCESVNRYGGNQKKSPALFIYIIKCKLKNLADCSTLGTIIVWKNWDWKNDSALMVMANEGS